MAHANSLRTSTPRRSREMNPTGYVNRKAPLINVTKKMTSVKAVKPVKRLPAMHRSQGLPALTDWPGDKE